MQMNKYGDCIEFCGGLPQEASGLVAVCIPSYRRNCSNCMFFDNLCPEVKECSTEITADGRCRVCPGEVCAYDKKGYFPGEELNSLDEKNKCLCNKDGSITCSHTEPVLMSELCNL
ncbi:uncharacterized protein LOC132561716 [Ylistrum balloti]|uniref:uncharacterized protein LOC132561716 n=1 Tax=Ylistrum balloti TaxID=509963 RepID=UPI0029058517|nr:uncharacterized protein LOC132561716 [Ylistrum balloti]